ncbi:NADH-dependent flavin oxidoreductase-like protein 1 [Elsinoe fawcettii]|nr:NADH-dependent flavin oxidoreductase-like protein 1 [Elsinoe fawcettii]
MAQTDASPLGKPLKFEFSGRTAPNRFLKGAMSERLASWDPKVHENRGIPSPELINLYRRWGEAGFGVILSGNVMVDYTHLEAAGNPIIPLSAPLSGPRFSAFAAMATAGKQHGSLMIAQVGHAGRQTESKVEPAPYSASDVQLIAKNGRSYAKPRAASSADIAHLIDSFAHAALYLEKAGWDGMQLHGAHGYLIAQFLSRTTNKRTDQYGGSLANRARLIVDIGAAVRKVTKPDFVLGIKLNSVEFQEDGFTPDEARELCGILEASTFDFVELSGGTYESSGFVHKSDSTRKRESFFLQFAETITPALSKTKSYVTGGLRSTRAMVDALEVVDGVGLGRPATHEPLLPRDILAGQSEGARKILVGDEQFPLTMAASVVQIRQVAEDKAPLDLTRKEEVEALVKDLKAWQEHLAKDTGFTDNRPAPIVSLPAKPFRDARL